MGQRWVSLARFVAAKASSSLTIKTEQQRPAPGSSKAKTLEEVYNFYEGRKARFEALASVVAERMLGGADAGYERLGNFAGGRRRQRFLWAPDCGTEWIRCRQADRSGQAKCESLNSPTGGNHIAKQLPG